MTSVKNRVARAVTGVHVAPIRSTRGRVGARMTALHLCILTTTGRKPILTRSRAGTDRNAGR